ncbi:MAG: bifunctional UDP-N-acetylglucosamine diphosphorylase/glucosamine-1-phosphate N-acetyltransferase GlmU [Anaerolineae bacterium]|nr:bifunctional UDP-N-acetylglucosamine diphosphorylase/glucosamine-1-phosphate N-acetyltransferase GlmU [Anaerolineae bacterium]
MNLAIVVLAAGEGTRMKSGLPKVMHAVAGRPMVRYVLDTAAALEPVELAVVVGYRAEMVRQALGEGLAYVEQAQQLGTGHAVQQAGPVLAGKAGTVLVLYGDTPLIRPETLQDVLRQHEAEDAAVTILTFHPGRPQGYGRIVREAGSGRVLAIVEEDEATPEQKAIGEVNSGILCFRDEWLWPNLARLERSAAGEFYLTDLVAVAREQGEAVAAVPVADPTEVIGVDHRAKLALAEAEMRRRINEAWMLSGVTMIDPSNTYIEAGVEIGADTIVWPNTLLQGRTRIGRECTVGPGTIIRDSTIGDGCRVEMSVLEGATMEDGSDVGPFGRLRKGAHLAKGAHMGNFGEVKNSYLGPGAKMGHFSYLGDATVGAGANIGAGTITCNYDGQRKHRTVIGEGAFIGSDTMLVAPVEIGAGATTGAGSVVTRDVPPGALAYGVPSRLKPSAAAGGSEEE